MPLNKGTSKAAREDNIQRLTSEIGQSPHVQSPAQAVAIAYSEQRRNKAKKAAASKKKAAPTRHFGSMAPHNG